MTSARYHKLSNENMATHASPTGNGFFTGIKADFEYLNCKAFFIVSTTLPPN